MNKTERGRTDCNEEEQIATRKNRLQPVQTEVYKQEQMSYEEEQMATRKNRWRRGRTDGNEDGQKATRTNRSLR